VLADPAIRAKLAEVGQTTLALGPQESNNFVRTESNRFKTLIERNGIKLEQ
jgi:tripartite-type tricarboxylate transporter receptor subunit TctC